MEQSYLIFRHGEAEYWGKDPEVFFPDIEWPLTLRWSEQSKILAVKLKTRGLVFDTIYSSPKERAIQTAKIATQYSRRSETRFELVESINSRFYGEWEWQCKAGFLAVDNRDIYYNDPHFKPPGGESNFDVYVRTTRWMKGLLEEKKPKSWIFAISTHSKVFDSEPQYLVGLPRDN